MSRAKKIFNGKVKLIYITRNKEEDRERKGTEKPRGWKLKSYREFEKLKSSSGCEKKKRRKERKSCACVCVLPGKSGPHTC
jgi:hypothetical protein